MGDIYEANNQRYEVGPGGLEQFLIDFPNAVLQGSKEETIEEKEEPTVEKIFLTGDDMDYIKYPWLKGTSVEEGLYFKTGNQLRNSEGNIVVDFRTEEEIPIEEKEQSEIQFQTYKQGLELGEIKEAARVRKMQANMGAVKVAQNVVQGDYIDDRDTIIKDSVVSKSNVGRGSSKMQELKDLTEMKKEGLIDDDEFKQMKKEILGK